MTISDITPFLGQRCLIVTCIHGIESSRIGTLERCSVGEYRLTSRTSTVRVYADELVSIQSTEIPASVL